MFRETEVLKIRTSELIEGRSDTVQTKCIDGQTIVWSILLGHSVGTKYLLVIYLKTHAG